MSNDNNKEFLDNDFLTQENDDLEENPIPNDFLDDDDDSEDLVNNSSLEEENHVKGDLDLNKKEYHEDNYENNQETLESLDKNSKNILDKLKNKFISLLSSKKEVDESDELDELGQPLSSENDEKEDKQLLMKKVLPFLLIAIVLMIVSILFIKVFSPDEKTKKTNTDNYKEAEEILDINYSTNDNEVVENELVEDEDNYLKENVFYYVFYIGENVLDRMYALDKNGIEANDEYFNNFLNKDSYAKILENNIKEKDKLLKYMQEKKSIYSSTNTLAYYQSILDVLNISKEKDEILFKILNENLGRNLINPTINKYETQEKETWDAYTYTMISLFDSNEVDYRELKEERFEKYNFSVVKIKYNIPRYLEEN